MAISQIFDWVGYSKAIPFYRAKGDFKPLDANSSEQFKRAAKLSRGYSCEVCKQAFHPNNLQIHHLVPAENIRESLFYSTRLKSSVIPVIERYINLPHGNHKEKTSSL